MQKIIIFAAVLGLILALSGVVVGDVQKKEFSTDKSWKTIDFEHDGWNSLNYDDSWWESAISRNWGDGNLDCDMIWYPGEWVETTAYFRSTFDIIGTNIVYGTLDTGVNSDGSIELYLNNMSIGTVKSNKYNPTRIDITSYLQPGTNVISAKVIMPKGGDLGWGLNGIVRYET